MRIIIDGYNLIRRIPELERLDRADMEEARQALIRELSLYRGGKRHQIVVVFDGIEALHLGGSKTRDRGVTVLFSPRGKNADRLILDALRNREADVLVSADRELISAADGSEVTSVSPALFWEKVGREMYRQFKGEEGEEEDPPRRAPVGRKLSKAGGPVWGTFSGGASSIRVASNSRVCLTGRSSEGLTPALRAIHRPSGDQSSVASW